MLRSRPLDPLRQPGPGPSATPARLLVALALLPLASCGLLRSAAEAPGRLAGAVLPEREAEGPPVDEAFADLLRYSDLLVLRLDEALTEFETLAGTRAAEVQAATWRLDILRWTTQIVTGPRPLTSLLDLLVIVTVERWMVADHWIPDVWGPAAEPIDVALELSERDGWKLIARYLTPQQADEARAVLARWRAQHPELERDALATFPSFESLAEHEEEPAPDSVFGALGLDPLAGLEPAARQIELARQLGQRALFVLQRAPRMLGAELQLRLFDARAELAAAGEELSAELTAQRAGLVRDIEAVHAPVRELLAEARATLAAGEQTAGALTGTIATLDGFVARFDEPEDAPAEREESREPFDVGEYGAAAERVGSAATDLATLLVELDRRLPATRALLDETAARAATTIDRAALALLLVGLALIAATALAAWLVRRPRGRTGAPAS
jgi:hypothetical protein